jgi:hypothetical protein
MPLDQKVIRKAGSLAFFALKKYKFYDSKTENGVNILSLFGDTYQFFLDKGRKLVWMVSKHHYQQSRTFKLATRHKEWEGIFSFPRHIVATEMGKHFSEAKMEAKGEKENRQLGIQYRIVASQVYKADKHKLARVFGGVLWKHLDREIACLAIKIFGLGANSIDYTLIWNNKEEILDTLQKAPGILPLWRDMILVKMCPNQKFNELYDTDGHSARSMWSFPAQIATKIDYPKDVDCFEYPNIIQTVKEALDKQGLTTAGWRYLIKLPPRFVSRIIMYTGGRDTVHMLNWLAAIGVVPRYTILKPLLMNTQNTGQRTAALTSLIRVGLTVAQKSRSIRNFWAGQFHLVLDWFNNANERLHIPDVPKEFGVCRQQCQIRQAVLDHNQMKAPWSWFMRQQEEWHANAAQRTKDKTKQQVWESALSEIEIKGYQIVPLTDAHALVDEGQDMHHCVANFVRNCVDGESRIFSIRKNGVKIATLELRNMSNLFNMVNAGKWAVNQVREVCNADASQEIKKIAEVVANKYNNALGRHFAEAV